MMMGTRPNGRLASRQPAHGAHTKRVATRAFDLRGPRGYRRPSDLRLLFLFSCFFFFFFFCRFPRRRSFHGDAATFTWCRNLGGSVETRKVTIYFGS